MNRRVFLKTVPAGVAGSVAAGVATNASASHSIREQSKNPDDSKGFRLIGERRDIVGDYRGMFPLISFKVECPYPVESRAWTSIADHDEAGRVVVYGEDGPTPFQQRVRRVIFPRLSDSNDLNDLYELYSRACQMYQAVRENGFDDARGPDHEWQVIHVTFHCLDGKEHVIAGLPKSWDPRICLGVMELKNIRWR